ncbi:MAG: hypothetical protein AAGF77_05790 [Bacteroidota bacterium]
MKLKLRLGLSLIALLNLPLFAQEDYRWDNVAIGGGGYVVGVVVHPTEPDLVYIRTDIGGVFRWDNVNRKWINLNGWISPDKENLFGVDGIALDKSNPDIVYACLGKYAPNTEAGDAGIYKSNDRGVTWDRVHATPYGGNWIFRWCGEPIAVDPNNGNYIYSGTRRDGLVRSTNAGNNFDKVTSVPNGFTGDPNNPWPGANASDGNTNNPIGIRTVVIDPSETVNGRSKNVYVGVYGTGIYSSNDGGNSFNQMAGAPSDVMSMAIRANGNLYVTTLNNNVWKYDGNWRNLNAPTDAWGRFNAIAVDPFDDNNIYVATCSQDPYMRLYRSTVDGYDGDPQTLDWTSVYPFDNTATVTDNTWHKGQLNFFQAATSALAFDPHHQGKLFSTDWYQVWVTEKAWDAVVPFRNEVKGHEEVVPLAICTPHVGVQLFSGHGDVTGFKHVDQDELPESRLVDKAECTGIDYCEDQPNRMAIVTANSWYGDGTEIFTSTNSGDDWTAMTVPGEGRNGKIAIASNDPNNLVYLFGGSIPYYSVDGGGSWLASNGAPDSALSTTYMYQYDNPLISDRTANNTFYLLDRQGGLLYRSVNGGQNWAIRSSDLPASGNWGNLVAGWGDTNNRMAVSLETDGLWLSTDSGENFIKDNYFSNARMVAMGKEKTGNSYPALYVFGVHNGQWGVYRSDNFGSSWFRINDNTTYVGNSVTYMGADRQEYGRVYIGNNGSGLWYGEIADSDPPSCIVGSTCDDNNATTENDVYKEDCICAGDPIDEPICTVGASCNDNNDNTENDAYNENCICAGDPIDEPICTVGAPCNDGNDNTENDVYNEDCLCIGEPMSDPICTVGSSCNDGDANTENDVYSEDCLCIGDPVSDIIGEDLDIDDGETTFIQEFLVYPNSSDGNFQVDITLKETGEVALKLFSMDSKSLIVQRMGMAAPKIKMDFDITLASGSYLLILETLNGSEIRKLLID